MKNILIIIVLIILAGSGYWYGSRAGWFDNTSPSNLPTKSDLERMDAVEKTSSQIAPNAVPGAGVRPVGSLPPAEVPTLPEDDGVNPDDAEDPQPLP